MKIKRILAILLALAVPFSLSACKNTEKLAVPSWQETVNQAAANEVAVSDDFGFWVTDSLDRVRKNRNSNGKFTIELGGAKGEYESFQVVAYTDSEATVKLTGFSVSDLVSEEGNVISSKDCITLYREHYINCDVQSPSSGKVIQETTGEIPDALIPLNNPETGEPLGDDWRFYALPYELSNTACQPFFVDIEIPRDAKTGIYKGVFKFESDKGIQGGEFTLKVWNIALSEIQTQGSFFGSWSSATPQKAEEAAKNRMFIQVSSADDEKKLYEKYGYNNTNIGFWGNVDIDNTDKMKAAPEVEKVKEVIAKHYDKLNLFAYTADEIGGATNLYDTIKEYGVALHKGGTKQLITMPPAEELLNGTDGKSAVDIWVMLPKQFDSNTEIINKAREKDCEIWTYNCLVQDNYSPKYLLDYPLIDHRIQPGFINYSLDADGFLFWVIDNWNTVGDPWTSLDMTYNGDGILFYPGSDVGIDNSFVPSLRAKAIRDGFEDYELCAAIEEAGGDVKDYINSIATDFSNWTQESKVLLEKRFALGEAFSK